MSSALRGAHTDAAAGGSHATSCWGRRHRGTIENALVGTSGGSGRPATRLRTRRSSACGSSFLSPGKSGRRRTPGGVSFMCLRKYLRRASSDSKDIPRHSTRPESRATDSRSSLGSGSLFAATFILPALACERPARRRRPRSGRSAGSPPAAGDPGEYLLGQNLCHRFYASRRPAARQILPLAAVRLVGRERGLGLPDRDAPARARAAHVARSTHRIQSTSGRVDVGIGHDDAVVGARRHKKRAAPQEEGRPATGLVDRADPAAIG